MLMAPWVMAGVSGDVAQELQMPSGPQALEDVQKPMPSRLATLQDPGTSDQIVLYQHSLKHFPSQSWCEVCVDSRSRDQLKIDAVVDYAYMGDGGLVPDSKKMDMQHVVAGTAKWVRDLRYERFLSARRQTEGVLQLLLDKVANKCRPEGQDWQIPRQVSPNPGSY